MNLDFQGQVGPIVFHSDYVVIAVDCVIHVYDSLILKHTLATLKGHTEPPDVIECTHSDHLISSSRSGWVYGWNIFTKEEEDQLVWRFFMKGVHRCVSLSVPYCFVCAKDVYQVNVFSGALTSNKQNNIKKYNVTGFQSIIFNQHHMITCDYIQKEVKIYNARYRLEREWKEPNIIPLVIARSKSFLFWGGSFQKKGVLICFDQTYRQLWRRTDLYGEVFRIFPLEKLGIVMAQIRNCDLIMLHIHSGEWISTIELWKSCVSSIFTRTVIDPHSIRFYYQAQHGSKIMSGRIHEHDHLLMSLWSPTCGIHLIQRLRMKLLLYTHVVFIPTFAHLELSKYSYSPGNAVMSLLFPHRPLIES